MFSVTGESRNGAYNSTSSDFVFTRIVPELKREMSDSMKSIGNPSPSEIPADTTTDCAAESLSRFAMFAVE